MPDFKMIPVHTPIHKRVKEIAAANHRSLGGQVAHWVNEECDHPAHARQVLDITYVIPSENMQVSRTARGYFCNSCKRFILTDIPVSAN